jgi:hypothetical protein
LHHAQCCSCSVIVAAIVLRVVLQSWEGEVGHVSVGKGGGRWKVGACCTVRWKRKKNYIQSQINIFVFLNLCEFASWCTHMPLPSNPDHMVTPGLYHMVSILSPQFFPCNQRLGSDTGHQNKLIATILVSWALNLGVGQSPRIYFFKVCLF